MGPGYRFGQPGTLALCSATTAALKSVPLPCPIQGYSGIMLPVCEDHGLAEGAARGEYSIGDLLQWSAVCGVGIDTVPCPGPRRGDPVWNQRLRGAIGRLLLDMSALAFRLRKPLSCRLLPVPEKSAGDRTDFKNPYMVESVCMPL